MIEQWTKYTTKPTTGYDTLSLVIQYSNTDYSMWAQGVGYTGGNRLFGININIIDNSTYNIKTMSIDESGKSGEKNYPFCVMSKGY